MACRFVSAIDKLNRFIAERFAAFLIYVLIAVTTYIVVARYILHISTLWGPELSAYLYATLFMLGGGYALYTGTHVGMDLIQTKLNPRNQAILRMVSSLVLFFFSIILLWKGSEFAWRALVIGEHSQSAWSPPVFPIKAVVPLAALLLLLQGLANLVRDLLYLMGVPTRINTT